MNGTQGFQGCPGQRGVKVSTLILTLIFNLNIFVFVNCQFCYLSNIITTLFSFSVQGGRGYSGEKVSVFLGFNKVIIINSNIQTVKKNDYLTNCFHVAG